MADDDIDTLSYEQALDELDRLITCLETDRVELEEALNCYERGTQLAQHCQRLLDRVEAKVTTLVVGVGDRLDERALRVEGTELPSPASGTGAATPTGTPSRARAVPPALFPGYVPDPPSTSRSEAIDPDDIPF